MWIKRLFSVNYVSWEEYRKRILDIESLRFMEDVCLESYQNLMERERRGLK
tara:strand:- start:10392 stop:10544 length:153 start_codon:yes stop_codon:yes gene_type:complete